MIHIYNQYGIEKKRDLRKSFEKQKALTRSQIDILEKNLIQPLRDRMKWIDEVLKSQISIEQYLERSKAVTKQVEGFLKKGD